MSRGTQETSKLRAQVEEQLNRLLNQLQDLEDNKEEFESHEYLSMRSDTLQQLKEFQESLRKMMQGNMTLVDEFGSVQLVGNRIGKVFRESTEHRSFLYNRQFKQP